jgi:hypothetical protein
LSQPEHPVIVKAVDALIGLAAFSAEQALAISLVKRQLDTEDLWERKRHQNGAEEQINSDPAKS